MTLKTWQPSATIDILKKRAQIIQIIRNFFQERKYLEVETPIMSPYGVTDVYLNNIQATVRHQSYMLHTSPEYHMKRLLAAGSGPIFQLARVFRDDELGRWHQPEFTMLEWYQLDIDHHQLMEEVDDLLQAVFQSQPLIKKTYQEVFKTYCAVDPFDCSVKQLQETVEFFGVGNVLAKHETCPDQFLFLLMSHVIEPQFAKLEAPVAVYDFPPSQAALAQINQGVAERFEVYYQGVELANGFHELTDAAYQIKRFESDNAKRRTLGLPQVSIDPHFIEALLQGLPNCSGVAFGVDRLIALALGQTDLSAVITFEVTSQRG